MLNKKSVAQGIGILALFAALTACSSNSKSTSSPSSAATGSDGGSAPAAASGSPIKLGEICSCTGPYGPNQIPTHDVLESWVKMVNSSGGLEGHPLKITYLDDKSSPGTSVTDAQQLISDHVAVIIDNTNFDVTWAGATTAAKIPVVGAQYSSAPFYTNPDFYPTGTTQNVIQYATMDTAKLAGATNLGNVQCAEVPECAQAYKPLKAAGEQLHVPVTYNTLISATAPNYTAQCVAAQQGKVTDLLIGEAEQVVVRMTADCDRQGYDPIYEVIGITFTPSLPTAPGVKKLAIPFEDMPIFSSSPEVQAMNAAVDKYYPGLRQSKGGMIWSQYAVGGWTAGLVIRDAVKDSGVGTSGTVSAATMTQGLNSFKNDTLDGWSPALTFTAGKAHSVGCWFTAVWNNGSPVLADKGHDICER